MRASGSALSRTWRWPALLAGAYVVAHLPFLPPSLEDIDSINFALGLRHFDPALHQPHPPGYPLYIALGHVSLAALNWLAPSLAAMRVEAVALAVWSLAGGALAIVAAAMFFRALEAAYPDDASRLRHPIAAGATVLLAVAPLFSISGVRPLSDMPGLALALLAQALIVRGISWPRSLVIGAFIAGLAGGIRVQSAMLTVPLLLGVLIGTRHSWRHRGFALAAAAAGGLAWGVPLLIVSGGPQAYLAALGSQAGEDFAWVDMLWSNPTPRLAALALYRTLSLAWGPLLLALVVPGLAAIGFVVASLRARRMLGVVCLAFGPYAVFHLLLQETVTIRYALPLVPPVAWLATVAIARLAGVSAQFDSPYWFARVCGAFAFGAFAVSISPLMDYSRWAHPAFRAIDDMAAAPEGASPTPVYSDYAVYRAVQASRLPAHLAVVPPVRQKEWLGPVEFFRQGRQGTVWFLADPLRTDISLFDGASVVAREQRPWLPLRHPEMGGARPVGATLYRLQKPGWMVGEGWSLTPEAGGRVRAAMTGLNHRPIDAYVARRGNPATFFVGGLHLGTPADGGAELTVAIDGAPVDTWTVGPEAAGRPFLRFVPLPSGVGQGPGPYATLRVSARPLEAGRPLPEIAIRQFDLQSDGGRPMMAFGEGWYEDEYSPETGQRWRWTGASAQLRLVSSRTVVLTIRGESPVKYVGVSPTVRVSAGARSLATFQPTYDFAQQIVVPADALIAANGIVTIETDRLYQPGAAEGSADTRQLGLRIFECTVDLQ